MVKTRNQSMEESFKRMDKEVVELSCLIKGIGSKNEVLETSLKVLGNRQETMENMVKDLNDKYEHMVGFMALMNQSMLNLSKDKQVEESSRIYGPGLKFSGRKNGDSYRNNQGKNEGRQEQKIPKIEFPFFDGEGPREWIRNANIYFQIHGIEEDQRTPVVEMYLKGRADVWYQGYSSGRGNIPWHELSTQLCIRFGEGGPEEAIEEFSKICQQGIVEDYQERFETLKALVMPFLPPMQESYYI
ncbi:hypothetical protein ACH5RR_009380 [Cinchona calisaya]|uniref:Retrotransposon gag domain-containing protein n=1 Tax=Cinchona calisaya TaxID=153742 RepID=A0ABD3AID6_9GENT